MADTVSAVKEEKKEAHHSSMFQVAYLRRPIIAVSKSAHIQIENVHRKYNELRRFIVILCDDILR